MQSDSERRYTMFLLFLVSVFSYMDRTIISILQVPIKQELGLSDAQLGALTGLSFALFYATLSLPLARLADRWVRKNLIAGSLAVWSAMTALSSLATGFVSLLAFRIGVAVGEAGSLPATHSIIADLYPPDKRATATSLWGLSLPLGLMLGFASGGILADVLGWRTAFAVIGGAGVLLAPIVLLIVREPKRGHFDPPSISTLPVPTMGEALAYLWNSKAWRYMVIGGTLHTFAWYSAISWNPPFYTRIYNMSLSEMSIYLALANGIGCALGMLLGGVLSDRFGRKNPEKRLQVVAVALLLMVPICLVQYFYDSKGISLALGFVQLALMVVYYGPIVAVGQSLVPASMRAFSSSVMLLSVNIFGLGLGPFLTGLLSDYLAREYGMAEESLRYALSAAIMLSLVAAGFFWLASKYLPRELEKISKSRSSENEHKMLKEKDSDMISMCVKEQGAL